METNEILLSVLKQLNMGDTVFNTSIVRSEMIASSVRLACCTILVIVLSTLARKFNEHFGIIDNLKELFSMMKSTYKTFNDNRGFAKTKPTSSATAKERNSNDEQEYLFLDAINDMLAVLNGFAAKYSVVRHVATLIVAYNEIKILFMLLKNIIMYAITLINCFYAPERILVDYISNLF